MPLKLENKTPFSCAHLPMLAPNGANILRFVVRATYDIGPAGGLGLAKKLAPVRLEDVYWGEVGKSGLRYESDASLDKPFVDLLVNGQAYAPHARPATSVDIGLMFQDRFVRRARVVGDRRWHYGVTGWRITDPKPFLTIPVTYDRAFGGIDTLGYEPRNRVGTGYATKIRPDFEGTRLPNVELAEAMIKSPTDRPEPAGLGVISRDSRERVKYAGTYDEAWLAKQFPLLPHDFDMRFNQSAPQDQWLRGIVGGESIKVLGMTADGVLGFRLPRGTLRLALHYRKRSVETTMPLDCVLIDCERRQLELTWRGIADTHGDPFQLETMIVNTDSPELTPKDCGCEPRSEVA